MQTAAAIIHHGPGLGCLRFRVTQTQKPVVTLHIVQTTAATSTVGQSMATATSAMKAVGAAADPQKMVETMQKFSRRALPLALPVFQRPLPFMCLLRQSLLELSGQHGLPDECIHQAESVQLSDWVGSTLRLSTSGSGACLCSCTRSRTYDVRRQINRSAWPCRENAQMDMAGEMMDDTLDDALDGADAEDETNDVVNQARSCAMICVCS